VCILFFPWIVIIFLPVIFICIFGFFVFNYLILGEIYLFSKKNNYVQERTEFQDLNFAEMRFRSIDLNEKNTIQDGKSPEGSEGPEGIAGGDNYRHLKIGKRDKEHDKTLDQ
jgi:hypothetical protein